MFALVVGRSEQYTGLNLKPTLARLSVDFRTVYGTDLFKKSLSENEMTTFVAFTRP
jgi:hypothetical protein